MSTATTAQTKTQPAAPYTPKPFPDNGIRKLTPREAARRVALMQCNNDYIYGKPACQTMINIGVFFDGTGNNMKADYDNLPESNRKHTNVVRLFLAYKATLQKKETTDGYYSIYIPGVGTPFPDIKDIGNKKEVAVSCVLKKDLAKFPNSGNNGEWTDGIRQTLGAATAFKGDDRINYAILEVLNRIHYRVFKAPLLDDAARNDTAIEMSASNTTVETRSNKQKELVKQLEAKLKGKKPTITQLNLSVFGFSRGSATARAFVNRLMELAGSAAVPGGAANESEFVLAGIPVVLHFLGIFDSVTSVGLTDLFQTGTVTGHQSWGHPEAQSIHPAVQQCMHFVAGMEVRSCFAMESARVYQPEHQRHGSYPANVKEVMYPGAHSDIGGGYAPGALGISPMHRHMLALIPGMDMYHEARKAGVPLIDIEKLSAVDQAATIPSNQLIKDYNAFLKAVAIQDGDDTEKVKYVSINQMHEKLWGYYLGWRFKEGISYFKRGPLAAACGDEEKAWVAKTQHDFLLKIKTMADAVGIDMRKLKSPKMLYTAYQKLSADQKKFDNYLLATLPTIVSTNYYYATVVKTTVKESPLFQPLVGAFKESYQVCKYIQPPEKITPAVAKFCSTYIHDSVAGFKGMGIDEFTFNGLGIFKFRSIYSHGAGPYKITLLNELVGLEIAGYTFGFEMIKNTKLFAIETTASAMLAVSNAAIAAKNHLVRLYEGTVNLASIGIEKSVNLYNGAVDATSRGIEKGVNGASDLYNGAVEAVSSAMEKGVQAKQAFDKRAATLDQNLTQAGNNFLNKLSEWVLPKSP